MQKLICCVYFKNKINNYRFPFYLCLPPPDCCCCCCCCPPAPPTGFLALFGLTLSPNLVFPSSSFLLTPDAPDEEEGGPREGLSMGVY